MQNIDNDNFIADAQRNNWVDRFMPAFSKPYLRLMRLDRPIGFWLLFWPCVFSLFLANIAKAQSEINYYYLFLFFVGAIIMRGAGCTFNDIIDKDIDKKIARTRSRPIASAQISVKSATIFLLAQLLLGLIILLQFNLFTVLLGASSLILVVIYPFMKRITWWPQLFLGLAFSWGALIGWAANFGALSLAPLLLYIGTVFWVIGYDTIYALQDIEDDALVGVKSTARLFGANSKLFIGLFYLAAIIFWLLAAIIAQVGAIFFVTFLLPVIILLWQILTLENFQANKAPNPKNALTRFKANHYVGLALSLAFLLEGIL